ncbi:glycoside hydrolase family 3 N-terminal domain-containing protein [Desulfosoma caldarium]|uniref:Beta-N-acetylhexosaminidase n=1 Tax=Desulfosoma caldarium TaxID=610254 RepID=A0A3N1VKX0_9BACT|nr:glycoside hydrolase family 3 N-terminal domain-containing protein [Desulfosoma caldarium]ROR01648.1 beta-N-acetylhexosaminidase [Desulfosoma caldarium]
MTLSQSLDNDTGQHLFLGFEGTEWTASLQEWLHALRPGGLVLFRRNVVDTDQITALIREANAWAKKALGRPLVWAVDEEGGSVQRLAALLGPAPSALELAKAGDEALRSHVVHTARGLHRLGIHLNLAPVLDVVASSKDHFLKSRSLGHAFEEVARLGSLWIRCLQDHGVAATAKHFPGLGTARLDPHDQLPRVEAQAAAKARQDLIPFYRAVQTGVRAVMTSHAVYAFWDPDWPGTLSWKINRGLLRDRWHFQGVLLSDDLDMKAIGGRYEPETIVRHSLLATVDGFLVCQEAHSAEVFARALYDGIRRHRDLQEAHRRSLNRLQALTPSLF